MHPFRKYLSTFITLSNSEWEKIEATLSRVIYQENELLLRQGQVCNNLFFLEEGFLRFFIYKNDGEEATKFFTISPYCFTSQQSFTTGSPTQDNIEALENSVVWEMKKSDAFNLLDLPAWSEFVRKLVQEVQFNTEAILQELQNKTAEERYIQLLEENSIILQKAPLKHIASFLGIAP